MIDIDYSKAGVESQLETLRAFMEENQPEGVDISFRGCLLSRRVMNRIFGYSDFHLDEQLPADVIESAMGILGNTAALMMELGANASDGVEKKRYTTSQKSIEGHMELLGELFDNGREAAYGRFQEKVSAFRDVSYR